MNPFHDLKQPKAAPVVACLLDGGWTHVDGVARRVVCRSKRKLRVDSSPVIAWADGVGSFELWTANGNVYVFDVDGTPLGYIPNSVPAAGAVAED